MYDFWKFVEDNAKVSPEKLRLKYHGKTVPFDIDLAITQIECRRRFDIKLATTLNNNPHWLFPSILAGEQSTSDIAAEFHTSLLSEETDVCDLTAGLGIDAIHFAAKCPNVTTVERDELKCRFLDINAVNSGFTNLKTVCADCREFIKDKSRRFNTIFIDPARRADDGSRVFSLSQCTPDIISMLPEIQVITPRLIIKMSPMLDISQTLSDLPSTAAIYSVGTTTECKELVADLRFPVSESSVAITAVTLHHPDKTFTFTRDEEQNASCQLATISRLPDYKYLLEPYPAVMKAAPYKMLSQHYNIDKIHNNTHLYLSDKPVDDFPGHTFRIIEIIKFESRNIKVLSKKYPQLQVTARNFPLSAEKLRSKLKTHDTGSLRLFAVTMHPDIPLMIIVGQN